MSESGVICDACGKRVVAAYETSEGMRWCSGCVRDVADIAEDNEKSLKIDAFLDRLRKKP